jgi:hypothetical protein
MTMDKAGARLAGAGRGAATLLLSVSFLAAISPGWLSCLERPTPIGASSVRGGAPTRRLLHPPPRVRPRHHASRTGSPDGSCDGLCHARSLAACLVLRGGKAKALSTAMDTKKHAGSEDGLAAETCISPLSAAFRRTKRRRGVWDQHDSPSAVSVHTYETPSPSTLPMLLSSGCLNGPETGAFLPVRLAVNSTEM